jgi:hypothetical protein
MHARRLFLDVTILPAIAKSKFVRIPAGRRANGFDHDGGETIFSLLNGLQAYFLNTAKGEALTGSTPLFATYRAGISLTNGISHRLPDQGMRGMDSARDGVEQSGLPKEVGTWSKDFIPVRGNGPPYR